MHQNQGIILIVLCITNALGVFIRRGSFIALAKTGAQVDFVQGLVVGFVIVLDIILVALLVKNNRSR
jgi:hypothetical protein